METKTFSTKSFAYRFLAWPEDYLPPRSRPQDICDLRRALIGRGLLISFLLTIAFGYLFSIASAGLYGLAQIFEFFSAYSVKTEIVKIGLVLAFGTGAIAFVVGLIFCIVHGLDKLSQYRKDRRYAREQAGIKPLLDPVTSPVKALYTSWKDKLCYQIEFKS